MKIAVIDTTIDSELIGGAQTFLPKLLSGLGKRGNEVHLITKGSPNEKVRTEIEKSKAIVHQEIWNPDGFVEDTTPVLAKWLNNLAPDIYLISVSPDIGWTVLPMLDSKIATLTIGHTDSDTFYLPAAHYKNFLTGAIGVSPEICSSYATNCGIDKENIDWIPYGIQSSPTEPTTDDKDFLKMIYVGRLEEKQKRVSDLIKISKSLSEENVKYEFSIIGDGEEMPKIESELRQEIADGAVVLHGWLNGEDVIRAMRESDVFVLTSAYEGFCIALIESMANGCCPIVTDIRSGNKQLIENGKNGFLIEIGNTAEFVEKIKHLNQNRTELLKMRRLAWETGKKFDVEKMVESYSSCFEAAIKDNKEMPRTIMRNFPLMETCRSRFPLWIRRIKRLAVGRD